MLDLIPVLMLVVVGVSTLAWLALAWQQIEAATRSDVAEPVSQHLPLLDRDWRVGLKHLWSRLTERRLATAVVGMGLASVLYVLLITRVPMAITQPGDVGHPFQGLSYVRELVRNYAAWLAPALALAGTCIVLGLLAQAWFWRHDKRRLGQVLRTNLLLVGICMLGLGQLAILGIYKLPLLGIYFPALLVLSIWLTTYTPQVESDLCSSTWSRWRELLLLALALMLTIFARFYRLDIYPYGIEGDESKWTIEVIGVMIDGTYPVSADLHMATVPLSFYMQAPFHYLFGASLLSARISVAFYSVLGSLCFYLLVRIITSPPVAWLSTMLLAVSLLDMSASRLANVESHVKLWPLLALLLLAYALRNRESLLYGLSGTAIALGLLTYETTAPIVIVALLIMLFELLRSRATFADSVRWFCAFLVPLLVVTPIVATYQIGRFQYYLDFGSGGNVREGNLIGNLWQSLLRVLETLFVNMETDFLFNRDAPLFNSLLLPLLVLGFVFALFHWKRARMLWMLLFAVLFFFPVPILVKAPLGRVYYPGLPAAYVLIAIAIYTTFRELDRALRPALRPALSMLAGVGLALVIVSNLYIYFNETFDTYDRPPRRELYDLALEQAGPDTMIYFPFIAGIEDPIEIERELVIPLGMRQPGTTTGELYPYKVLPLDALLPALSAFEDSSKQITIVWDTAMLDQREVRDTLLTNLLQCYPEMQHVKGQLYDRYIIPGNTVRGRSCTP